MALDMSKYAKMSKVERKLPIIVLINEKGFENDRWDGGWRYQREALYDIISNLKKRNIESVVSLVSFGDEINLRAVYKDIEKYTEKELPQYLNNNPKKSVLNVALTLAKDMLEDIDTTPEGNYDPVIILFSSGAVTPGYEKALKELNTDGRFSNIQKIGVAGFYCDGKYYANNFTNPDSVERTMSHAPSVLSAFAGENVAVYVSDDAAESWWCKNDWGKLENKDEYTWFCPVLNMIELRYTEDGQTMSTRLSGDRINNDPTRSLFMGLRF